jgi:trk system potassium uptake protein TrkA
LVKFSGDFSMATFAVIGLGRFGQRLAVSLAMSGAEVIAIDRNKEPIDAIRDQVSLAIRLDSTDEEALQAQGINKVDIAIVSIGQGTGQGFESAVLTVVNLKQLGVKQIYARAEDMIAGQVFSKIGATEVIYPEVESAQRWAYKLIAPHISEKIDFAPGYSLARVIVSSSFHGKTVKELKLRQDYNVNLVAVIRKQENIDASDEASGIINVPLPTTVIYKNDIMLVAGSDADLAGLPND